MNDPYHKYVYRNGLVGISGRTRISADTFLHGFQCSLQVAHVVACNMRVARTPLWPLREKKLTYFQKKKAP